MGDIVSGPIGPLLRLDFGDLADGSARLSRFVTRLADVASVGRLAVASDLGACGFDLILNSDIYLFSRIGRLNLAI